MILKNKNILITGAGKGIGESTVHTLLENGAFVYALIKDKNDSSMFLASPADTKDFLLMFFTISALLKFICLFTILELKFHLCLKIC